MTKNELLDKLTQLAKSNISKNPIWNDADFNPADGGNFDDSFALGVDAGSHMLAEEILELITGQEAIALDK